MPPTTVANQTVNDVIYLASCAVREKSPDPTRVRHMNLDHVYSEAEHQLLASCCAFALEAIGMCTEDFEQARAIAIRRTILMDVQRKEILDRLEEAGIWYLPLKGIILKDYYPSVGMREMTDNDILFDSSRTNDMREIMNNLGFRGERFDDGGAHDCFYKEPIYNFEMHRVPFDDRFTDHLNAYYENIMTRLQLDEGTSYGYHFSLEDFYLYNVAHEYKHFNLDGTGLRGCFDTYCFLSKATLDMDYVAREAERMGLGEFERSTRHLSFKLITGEELTRDELHDLSFRSKSGAHGSLESKVEHIVQDSGGGVKGRARYLLSRAFPPMKDIAKWYPFFYRHKSLLPLIPIVRLGRALTTSRHKVLGEIKALRRN